MIRGGHWYNQNIRVKELVRERDNYICQLCGQPGDVVDHIKPWRVSHDSTVSHLRILCRPCNLVTRRQRKDANPFTSIGEWYQYLERELAKYERH